MILSIRSQSSACIQHFHVNGVPVLGCVFVRCIICDRHYVCVCVYLQLHVTQTCYPHWQDGRACRNIFIIKIRDLAGYRVYNGNSWVVGNRDMDSACPFQIIRSSEKNMEICANVSKVIHSERRLRFCGNLWAFYQYSKSSSCFTLTFSFDTSYYDSIWDII